MLCLQMPQLICKRQLPLSAASVSIRIVACLPHLPVLLDLNLEG